jgi:rhamnosyltransferase
MHSRTGRYGSRVAPPASIIVRCRDERATLERTLRTLHAQTVRPEIIVVDSGSVDGSLELAQREADRVIRIAPEEFTYGRALNVGARAAAAPVHFALSSHCFAPPEWVERSLAHYERADVAGANGIQTFADGSPVTSPFFQEAAHARSNPWWGFSNHASSWRAEAWRRFPFDEELDYAEDREWALRVTAGGWTLVYDPALWVDMSHSWSGWRNLYTRRRRAARAVAAFSGAPPYGLRDLARDWWADIPSDRHSPAAHRFLNMGRMAGLAGHYVGRREAVAARR